MVHDFPRHAHQSHLLVLIIDGAREMDLLQQTIQIGAGQGFFLPAGTSHACRSIGQHDYYAMPFLKHSGPNSQTKTRLLHSPFLTTGQRACRLCASYWRYCGSMRTLWRSKPLYWPF